jgi:hypothetical protein
MEYGTKVLHEVYGEGMVLREQINMLEVLFQRFGIIAVRLTDKRLKVMEGIF